MNFDKTKLKTNLKWQGSLPTCLVAIRAFFVYTTPRPLCTEEARTPKAKPHWGKNNFTKGRREREGPNIQLTA